MDLSEKRKQLEALRAARLQKQQLVEQLSSNDTAAAPKPAATAPRLSPATSTARPEPVKKSRPSSPAVKRAEAVEAQAKISAAAAAAGPRRSPPPAQTAPVAPPALMKPTTTTTTSAPPHSAASPRTPTNTNAEPPRTTTEPAPAAREASVTRASPSVTRMPNATTASSSVVPNPSPQAPTTASASPLTASKVAPAPAVAAPVRPAEEPLRKVSAPRQSSSVTTTKSEGFNTLISTLTSPPSSATAATAPRVRSGEEGLASFHRWGTLSDDTVQLPQCVPACALSGKLVVGSKGRLIRSTAVTELPIQQPGDGRPEMAACVIAAYAKPPFPPSGGPTGTAVGPGQPGRDRSPSVTDLGVSTSNSLGGMDRSVSISGGGRVSPTNAASITGGGLAAADAQDSDIAVRDARLSETGYAWGTSATSRIHRFAGPSANATLSAAGSADRIGLTGTALKAHMLRLTSRAAGLAVAWTVVVLHELEDGSVADTLTVVTPLVCDSEIMCLATSPLRPATVYGGLRCGRIVCWNLQDDWCSFSAKQLRAKALASSGSHSTYLLRPRRPAVSSFPSPLAHQGPVLYMDIRGDPSAPQLHSVSQEGKVCTWSALDPSMPITSRSAYVGSRFLGSHASTAVFTLMRGSGAVMDVVIGTSTGAVLRGVNRDNRVVELTPLWHAPQSSTLAERGAGASRSSHSPDCSLRGDRSSSPTGRSLGNAFAASLSGDSSRAVSADRGGPSGGSAGIFAQTTNEVMHTWGLGLGSATGGSTPPHLGSVTAVAVQPVSLSAGVRENGAGSGSACVVSAATDGSCVAWVDTTPIPLSGFLSVVTCMQWSPTHLNVFAVGDAFGLVTIWNLRKSVTVPLAKTMLGAPLPTTRSEDVNTPIFPLHPSLKQGQRAADYLGQRPLRGKIRGNGNEASPPAVSAPPDLDGGASESSLSEFEMNDRENDDVATTEFLTPGEGATAVTSLTFSRDGKWLFAGNASGLVYVLMLSQSLWR